MFSLDFVNEFVMVFEIDCMAMYQTTMEKTFVERKFDFYLTKMCCQHIAGIFECVFVAIQNGEDVVVSHEKMSI